MLHLIVWVAVYTLIVWLLGSAVRSWRHRHWFKVLFLPGTLVAALVQSISALLCLGSVKEVHFFRDGKPFLEFDRSRIAYVGGGLFVLLAHGLFFTVFLLAVTQMEAEGLLDAHAISLPDLYPYEMIEGDVDVSVRPYLEGSRDWLAASRDRPLVMLGFFYCAFALFASMSISGLEWRRGAFILVALGGVTWLSAFLGVSFSLFSRGWWMGWFQFPDWWELFSLFVTLSALTLVTVGVLRLTFRVCRRASKPPQRDKSETGTKKKSKSKAKSKAKATA
jgi:hypothetical protein